MLIRISGSNYQLENAMLMLRLKIQWLLLVLLWIELEHDRTNKQVYKVRLKNYTFRNS